MASLKALKGRIASVKSTQKITKAMKMVAASKLRRAQEAAVAARPYVERMERMVGAEMAEQCALEAGDGVDRHVVDEAVDARIDGDDLLLDRHRVELRLLQ